MTNDFNAVLNKIKSDPRQVLSILYNIPSDLDLQDPNAIIQYLLNSRQVSQMQVNRMMALQNNPLIMSMLRR